MTRYIARRILFIIPVVVAVAVFIFTILYFVPGDPASIILGAVATEEELAMKRAELGIDQSFPVQLGRFLSDLFLHGNLGTSFSNNVNVADEILMRLPYTATIAGGAMVMSLLIGIPLGVFSAIRQDTFWDRATMVLAVAGVSIPSFWLAMLLVLLFSLTLHWLPANGIGSFRYFILPIMAESVGGIATLARQSRSSMLEVIRSDYVITAKAKGLSPFQVIVKHALPNAMLPIISVMGGWLGVTLGGSLVIEQVFSIPGIGMYMTSAITNRDYPVVRGCVVFLAIVFCVVMLLTDLCYAAVDPSIRATFSSVKRKKEK